MSLSRLIIKVLGKHCHLIPSFFIFQVGEDDDNDDGDDGDDDDEVSVMDQPSVAGVVSRSIRDGPFVAVAQSHPQS